MTAKEMFEALGFRYTRTNTLIQAYHEFSDGETFVISIDKIEKTYEAIYNFYENIEIEGEYQKVLKNKTLIIDIELHQAITQQMKELGWLE